MRSRALPTLLIFFLVALAATAALLFSEHATPLIASDGNAVAFGAAATITGPDSVCKKVINNTATGHSEYIPTASVAEWQSFYNNPPAGVTLSSCVAPGSQTLSTPGTYAFTVPPYNTLTVEAWGGGGGGALKKGGNTAGGASTFDIVSAGGGAAGTGVGNAGGGVGGTASGGDVNINGLAASVTGGDGANGGGAGGTAGIVYSVCCAPGGAPGGNGNGPGGGGGGGPCEVRAKTSNTTQSLYGGGGGGAYVKKTYAAGALSGTIAVTVGAGGAGAPSFYTNLSGNQTWCSASGAGAPGEVLITWQ